MRADSNQFLIFSGRVESCMFWNYRIYIHLHGVDYRQGGYDILIEKKLPSIDSKQTRPKPDPECTSNHKRIWVESVPSSPTQ